MERRVAFLVVAILLLVPLFVAAGPVPQPPRGTKPEEAALGASSLDCPASGGVIVYLHIGYYCGDQVTDPGFRQRLTTGLENITGEMDDNASSLRVPAGWSVRLYDGADGTGASVCRDADDPDFVSDWFDGGTVPLNDHVSSFEVFDNPTCSDVIDYVVGLWDEPNYGGTSVLLTAAGWQNLIDLGFNDVASSIRIDAGWSARVYQDANSHSPSWCFTGSDPDFQDNRFENRGPLDNILSAVEIFAQPTCPSLPVCAPALVLNCGQTHDYNTTWSGSTDQIDTWWCVTWPETGREVAYAFTPDRLHRVSLTLTSPVDLDLFVIDGWLGSCSTGGCILAASTDGNESAAFTALAGHPYYIVVEGYDEAEGAYTLNVQCAPPQSVFLPLVSKE